MYGTTILFTIPNPFGSGIAESQIYLFSLGLGIIRASIMAMPLSNTGSLYSIRKTGVYMGIFNIFIVIPMIIQIGIIQNFVYGVFGNNPINIISLAGLFLILGGLFSLRVKT